VACHIWTAARPRGPTGTPCAVARRAMEGSLPARVPSMDSVDDPLRQCCFDRQQPAREVNSSCRQGVNSGCRLTPTIAPATKSLLPSSCCHQPRQSTPLSPKPPPPHRQIPIVVNRQPGAPRVPSWEAFGRRPSERASSYDRASIRNSSPKLDLVLQLAGDPKSSHPSSTT